MSRVLPLAQSSSSSHQNQCSTRSIIAIQAAIVGPRQHMFMRSLRIPASSLTKDDYGLIHGTASLLDIQFTSPLITLTHENAGYPAAIVVRHWGAFTIPFGQMPAMK